MDDSCTAAAIYEFEHVADDENASVFAYRQRFGTTRTGCIMRVLVTDSAPSVRRSRRRGGLTLLAEGCRSVLEWAFIT
ncbi:MAG: hypothetical protein R3A47_03200 [Polyangiales bacterium]